MSRPSPYDWVVSVPIIIFGAVTLPIWLPFLFVAAIAKEASKAPPRPAPPPVEPEGDHLFRVECAALVASVVAGSLSCGEALQIREALAALYLQPAAEEAGRD